MYPRLIDPSDCYSESELRSRYRFGREGIQFIVDLLTDAIYPVTRRSHSLSTEEQVLITLRVLATGSFLQVIGDTFGSYDKSTVSRVVRRVTQVITAKVDDFVKFPTTRAERNEVKQGLYCVRGFPCAIGCVDGTHVKLSCPLLQNEPDYVCRKGFHSINVQAICYHEGKYTTCIDFHFRLIVREGRAGVFITNMS